MQALIYVGVEEIIQPKTWKEGAEQRVEEYGG